VNDKAVPLLNGAPPKIREGNHDCHATDIHEKCEKIKSPSCVNGSQAIGIDNTAAIDTASDFCIPATR
jgi:hypothetical protein